MARRRWMVCEVTDRRETACLFDEDTALRRGDPPRCIRHGALLFGAARFDGLPRPDARKRLDEEMDR